ncbi:hypothetical protein SEVIR_8G243200v4 [Setaria viridis]|uniref:Retrovirus-related Pol polyprotein from transposon TNT 1-94-like beta-barrel domain-containing protein n=1 Tax=Setaria viridis TaxID=4556 RepID=A0A4U6TMM9_SETVI|nr:uncharacterized protein LOC117866883 [Setaria viridis]TKW02425.1 hypothetical protein SEVIR_8G243200v2 [Setaria viridis]
MPGDTAIISAKTNLMLPKDLAIQRQGSWQISTPWVDCSEAVTQFSIQEDKTAQGHHGGGVLICPLVPTPIILFEETRENLDVPAEEDGAQQVASPVRGSILMFVHGRGPNDFQFILDSGAAVHATPRYYLLKDLVAVAAGQSVRAANGKDVQVRGRGRVSLENFITLDDVDYIPGLISNIVSVAKLTELDYIVQFTGDGCFVTDTRAGGSLVGRGRLVGGVFVLEYLLIPRGRAAAAPQGPA